MSKSDREARLRELYDRYAAEVYAYARRRGFWAEEIVSDTFLAAWRRIDDVPSGHELPWLLKTARFCIANQERSRRRQSNLMAELERSTVPAEPEPEGRSVLAGAFNRLSPDDREVLALIAWEGLSAGDAARVLGCRRQTFAVRLHRARRRLASLMAEDTVATQIDMTGLAAGEES